MAGVRPLEVQQIQTFLKAQFADVIQGVGKDDESIERNFLSKALAAYFLMVHAGASKVDAVAASIDGGNDHGIDSVYLSPTGIFWLVQSKYIHEGKGEPSLGDASKFKDGVKDFAAGKFERFNQALIARLPAIRAAMDNPHAIHFALVYTGTSLNDDRIQLFSDVESGLNVVQPGRARFVRFGLADFHDSITANWAEWAAAGFDDTLLRWKMKPEVVHGEKKDIQPRVQARGGQAGHRAWRGCGPGSQGPGRSRERAAQVGS